MAWRWRCMDEPIIGEPIIMLYPRILGPIIPPRPPGIGGTPILGWLVPGVALPAQPPKAVVADRNSKTESKRAVFARRPFHSGLQSREIRNPSRLDPEAERII